MRIIVALACLTTLASPALAATKTTTKKANPLATPAPTPLAAILTVTEFKPEEFAIQVQSSPQTREVKYLLSKRVRYVDADTGKAVDPGKIRPGTRVRLEKKTKGTHGVYTRVVVLQPDRA
jgi:hypothetical protein